MGDKDKKRKRPLQDQYPGVSKRPRSAISDLGGKRPVAGVDVERIYDQHPSWRVSKLETVGPFGWATIGPEKLLEICTKLAHLEALTWREILMVRKKQNHHIPIEELCPEAQKRLRQIMPDVDEILSLRLAWRQRVHGVLQGPVMLVLWWDPNHEVCPGEDD